VIGAETVDGDAMAKSLEKGERITLAEVGPFSDGTAVRIVGEEPFRICRQLLDDVVKVDNDELCAAIKDIFEGNRYLSNMIHFRTKPPLCRNTLRHRTGWSSWSRRTKTPHHQ
jgi:threonine dehydratase